MTRHTDMQRMTPIAPLVDQLQDIVRDELPAPRTCRVTLWDDGDYEIVIYHNHGEDEDQGIYYDVNTGDDVWKYRKNGDWVVDKDAPDGEQFGTAYVREFEESETRWITTIDPPFHRGSTGFP